jgi:uncharacterized membrane protein HdeD (DUF308 family)
MEQLFSKYWWTFIVRGLVAILFGLSVLFYPGLSLDFLVVTFALFALLQGALSLIPGLSQLGGRVYFLLSEGVVGILAGIFTFIGPGVGRMVWPEIAARTLLFIIAFWAVLTGIGEVIGSFRLPGEIKEKWAVTLGGLVCLLLGVILLFRSGPGAVGNAWLIGLAAVIFGLSWLFLGFKARNYVPRVPNKS